jgi:NTP pyrophosphatase (non-canonical NTP hydrolase)
MNSILEEIKSERQKQDVKWGEQNHNPIEWIAILTEEVGEASKAALEAHFRDPSQIVDYRKELIQVAAVAVAMIESLDRNNPSY